MGGIILNLLLLMLKILLDLGLDIGYKQSRFSETQPEKSLKFVLSRRNSIVAFILGFILLPIEVNFISKKQGCKGDMLVAYRISYVKMIFTLLTKVVALYMQIFIV